MPEFAELHVFGSQLLSQEATFWEGEKEGAKAPLLQATVELSQFWCENDAALDEIWADLPEQWTDNAADFILEDVRSHLDRVESDDFWGIEFGNQTDGGEN